MLMGCVILLNAHSLHRVETCDLAVRPTPPPLYTQYVKDIGFTRISQVVLAAAGGGPDPRTPLDAAAPGRDCPGVSAGISNCYIVPLSSRHPGMV